MKIFQSSTRIVLLFVFFISSVWFLIGKLNAEQRMILATMVATFFFTKKWENTPMQ